MIEDRRCCLDVDGSTLGTHVAIQVLIRQLLTTFPSVCVGGLQYSFTDDKGPMSVE